VQWGPTYASNETTISPRAFNSPVKRTFTTLTQDDIPTYLPNQFNGSPDPTYGAPTALVEVSGGEETDNTVVVQQEFENVPFAIGSRGLHGCTMVTIVSTRAVYMVSSMRSPCCFPLSLVADFPSFAGSFLGSSRLVVD
jgi:hypothetical protein